MAPYPYYQDIEVTASAPTHAPARRLFGKPIVRWLSLAFVLGTSVWLLYPYFTAWGFVPMDKRPSFLPEDLEVDGVGVGSGSGSGAAGGANDTGRPSLLQDGPIPAAPSWDERREQVKNAYKHALKGYLTHAFPNDELAPLSGTFTNKYNGWGVSLIDSLDTMWIMGLRDEFDQAMEHVAKLNFTLPPGKFAPFFETTIRYLGGLLSAYALSGSPLLLARADDLGQKLLPAFNGTRSGLPAFSVHPETGKTVQQIHIPFAEAASCQLEFKYLAKLTGRAEYYHKVENVMSIIYQANVTNGLFPEIWSGHTGEPIGAHLTAGASVDSGYEYLLKQYLLVGDVKARDQYIKSANGIIDNLLYLSPNRSLLYATDLLNGRPSHRYEHLTCFLPGMLALGAHAVEMEERERERHVWAARGLAYTCYLAYADQESGLGPDVLQMKRGGRRWVEVLKEWEKSADEGEGKGEGEGDAGMVSKRRRNGVLPPGLEEPVRVRNGTWTEKEAKRDYYGFRPGYLLRPETVESLFLLWKTTGEGKWRERGWEIFEAIEAHSRTKYGYANVAHVDDEPFRKDNDMPSWFLAETLKYLYLLFDDTNPVSLDKWVFNTEAHPFPVFNWTDWEKRAYGILY